MRPPSAWVAIQREGDKVPTSKNSREDLPAPAHESIDVVRAAGWERFPWLLHGFSTRSGGKTTAYRSGPEDLRQDLNLGFNDLDPEENVLANRQLFLAEVTGHPSKAMLVTLRQIHSTLMRRVGATDATDRAVFEGDGLMTDEQGVVLGIQTADCIPVLIADTRSHAVAAFHAGWRGTVARIVESGVGRMQMEFGSRPEDLIAAIGPGIGQCCYSVGEEVLHQFHSQFRYADELFCEAHHPDEVKNKYPLLFLSARAPGHTQMGPSLHLDLVEANRRQLLDAGVKAESIAVAGECTSCNPQRYFSHRGERGFTGRMLSVIGTRA